MSNHSGLPELTFVERDSVTIEANIVAKIEEKLGQTLALGDPRRAVVSGIAALLVQERQNINIAGRQNLLDYSFGQALLEIGKLVLGDNYPLLPASPALTTVRFTLSGVRGSVTTIPAGTLVATTSNVTFATNTDIEIAAGLLTGDVAASAVVAGTSGNGFLPGQINKIATPIPFVASVTNLTESSGGAPQESENAYRERVRLAPSTYSVAGPEAAYVFWAKTASTAIADVSVTTLPVTNPGELYVRPLLTGGVIPGNEVLDLVEDALNDKERRPLTDKVNVLAPTAVAYNITMTYYIDAADSARSLTIQAAVQAAVLEYRAWQRAKLGRDVNPDKLRGLVMQAGAKRVTVTAPVHTVLTLNQVAQEGAVSVTYGGLEDA